MNKQEIEKAIALLDANWDSLIDSDLIDCETLCTCYNALEQQLTNGWIPVEKELPKFTDDYLVSVTISTSFGDFETVRTLPFYRKDGKGGWLLPENFDEVWKVRAWRELPEPLPEPYKEIATDNNVVTKSGKDNNVLTIGDKIRESNRSLAYMLGSLCS